MNDPRTNDDYQSPSDEELRSLVEQMLQDVFENDEDDCLDYLDKKEKEEQ